MDGNGIQWDDDYPIILNITYENPFSSDMMDDYHDYRLQEQIQWDDDDWWLLMIMMGI